ncbi:ATPase family gene 2 protein [Wickerhamiella sorbophila]|uniref:ATPase family gene 2 protein n=1 Tax=Wickerhamiella sorbophila TaxID=45607 RepID=A0A2T0FLR0_9ASCO|nr:ATPase family gene 2 protein [Wickerhamiella sorbophila]PRT55919.1 ATPase family gene 2 protein [Wickerhamiella sorbophila]
MSKSASSGGTKKFSVKPKPPPSPTVQELIVRPSNTGAQNGGKIYLDLETIRALGLEAGACASVGRSVFVTGTITPTSCDLDVVEIPQELRRLSGLVAGDRVTVKPAPRPDPAGTVFVFAETPKEKVAKLLKSVGIVQTGLVIDGIEIVGAVKEKTVDDIQSLALSSTKNLPLTITDSTKIVKVDNGLPKSSKYVGYSSIGGLKEELKLLRSKIELPLNRPELFERFQTPPERGFLLYGPPGTGKTLLLKAIANETDNHILRVNGPAIYSKYLGETESALRSIFDEAERFAPAIVFIDEIDALAPKRDSDESGETESRVVATLLTLMDGMNAGGRVVIVGATNRPNNIDPALRRPGRFGQEIEVGIPSAQARQEILQILLSAIPHHLTPLDIEQIASKTHGYVGADLQALSNDAVMCAIQGGLQANKAIDDMFLERDDVEKALVHIRPSAMREVFLETPKVFWSDIGGQADIIRRLKEAVEWPLTQKESFERLGIVPPRGVLLYGPPGCSKTLLAKALATETGLNFLAVKGPELFNKFVGESERAVREIFRKARAAAPSIIFFDEIDALTTARGESEAGGDRVLTSLLNEMDGIESLNGVVILAATNRPDVIDSALMRPGRLDRLVYVRPPDRDARRQILLIQFAKMALDDSVNLEELADATEGCSGAEVVSICQEAGILAMNESVDIAAIRRDHFLAALSGLRKNITASMLEYFENFDTGRL